ENLVVGVGSQGSGYCFANLRPSRLMGFVYVDPNNNALREAGEPGIAGALVTLSGTDDRSRVVELSQYTNADGYYEFGGLRPGTYAVTEAQPAGYLDGKDAPGNLGGVTGNDQTSNIVLPSGILGGEYNFGELLPARLAGFVYEDGNNNGLKEAGEAG